MNGVFPKKIIVFILNLISLAFLIFYPGTNTLISSFIILVANFSSLFSINNNNTGFRKDFSGLVKKIGIVFIIVFGVVLFLFATNSKLECLDGMPMRYSIVLNDNMAFIGGYTVKYSLYAIPFCIVILLINIIYLLFGEGNVYSWKNKSSLCIK